MNFLCPACHHDDHDPGACEECPRCELHTDEALDWVIRIHPELLRERGYRTAGLAMTRKSDRSSPILWRIWWRFGFPPIIRLVELIPVPEWRRELWIWRLDIWAMDHIGKLVR